MSTDGDAVLEQVDGHLKRNIFLHIDDRIRIFEDSAILYLLHSR